MAETTLSRLGANADTRAFRFPDRGDCAPWPGEPARQEPIVIPPPPANANRIEFELRGVVVPFPDRPAPDAWNEACGIVAQMEPWELLGAIETVAPWARRALDTDNLEGFVSQAYVMHAAVTRLLLEIGRLPE